MRSLLSRAYRRWMYGPSPNLVGDRDMEWSWVVGSLPDGPGLAVDVGAGTSWLGLAAVRRGWTVWCLDLQEVRRPYRHPDLHSVRADARAVPFAPAGVDLVVNCSTIEHVGLRGRYGVEHREPDGDLQAMEELRRVLHPEGLMLLTLPVGVGRTVEGKHRVYGEERLGRLLRGWRVAEAEYWVKDEEDNRWVRAEQEEAVTARSGARIYGLGMFRLELADTR